MTRPISNSLFKKLGIPPLTGMTISSILCMTFGFGLTCTAQDISTEANLAENISNQNATKKPELIKIDATRYSLGNITIDKKKRTISFDATTEITENLIEYVLVNPEGKIHESLFVTKASPTNLNIAFKLLGYQENKSLFREFVNDLPTEFFQEASDESTKSLAKWSYGGSFIHKGQFIAELNRDIIAVFTDRSAIANYTGKGREDDTLWFPLTKKVPAFGSKVKLTITPEFPVKKK